MATLKEYLDEIKEKEGTTISRFSRQTGISYVTLVRLKEGKKTNKKHLALQISRITRGAVPLEELYEKKKV